MIYEKENQTNQENKTEGAGQDDQGGAITRQTSIRGGVMLIGNHSPIHKRRLEWLRRNKKYWNGYDAHLPGAFATEKLLLDKMKAAGLYPPATTLLDVSLERLIHKIRTTGRPKKSVAKRQSN